jgi:alpha-glucosidase
VAWDWWNDLGIYHVDFKAGVNTRTYEHYIDFAHEFKLEYIILDEGWYHLEDVLKVKEEIDLEEIISYGKEKEVGIILWVTWKALYDQMDAALQKFQDWGVKGIKVDFMQRDDQWMVNYYTEVAKKAAKHRLLVDFHGAYKPTGLHRTYPNVLTFEGVAGLEQSKWGEKANPEHDLILPFLRMVAGPMDYTPGAMINATQESFRPIWSTPMSQGTRCHQLAMYVVYESPLQMLSDNPTNYRKEPEAMSFLSRVPVTWDETHVLKAAVSDYVIIARRKGQNWYVGAMTDWTPREMTIDLGFLGKGKWTMESWADGPNADKQACDYVTSIRDVDSDTSILIKMAEGGGWAAIFSVAD